MINEESSLAYVLSPAVQVMQSSFEQQVNDQVSNGRAAIIQLNNGDISLMTEEKSQHLSVSFEKVQVRKEDYFNLYDYTVPNHAGTQKTFKK
ncbi:DNA-directed RNA polymerase subunit beta [Trichinella pseudospiralis]